MDNEIELFKAIPIRNIATALGIKMSDKATPISCPSPSHNDKNPSFMIYEDTNTWHCFSRCGSGTNIDLVCLTHGKESSKSEMTKYALNWGRENGFLDRKPTNTYKSNTKPSYTKPSPIINKEPKKKKVDHSEIFEFLIDSMPFIEKGHYLERVRGLSLEVLRENNVRAVEEGKDYKKILVDKFGEGKLKESGILSEKGHFMFWNCNSVFPFYKDGKLVYLQGRGKDNKIKYTFLKGVLVEPVYIPKMQNEGPVYICEGIITALSFLTAGIDSIAILSNKQDWNTVAKAFDPFRSREFVFAPDIDKDGGGEAAFKDLQTHMFYFGFNYKKKFYDVRDTAQCMGLNKDELESIKDYNDLLQIEKRRELTHV